MITISNILFTAQTGDPGNDSAGSARLAESGIANERMISYVHVARNSEGVRESLAESGITQPPTTLSPTAGFTDASARVLIDVPTAGVVEVRLKNGNLGQPAADQIVDSLSREVAQAMIATDSKQESPSLLPNPLLTAPQAVVQEPPSRLAQIALLVLLFLMAGLGLVYLIVWRQGRIYSRKDIEDRLNVRVLGDFTGRPAEGGAIALALTKGREAGTEALLVPVGNRGAGAIDELADLVATGGTDVGLQVTAVDAVSAVRKRVASAVASNGEVGDQTHLDELNLVVASTGLDPAGLSAAMDAAIVALVVVYGESTFDELTSTGQTLAEVTGAEIAVIGVRRLTVKK